MTRILYAMAYPSIDAIINWMAGIFCFCLVVMAAIKLIRKEPLFAKRTSSNLGAESTGT